MWPTHYDRWPAKGYVRGSLRSLFTTIQGAAIPQSFIQKGADALELGAAEIAANLNSMVATHAGVVRGRATLPPGTSPGSAMILPQASGSEDLSVWMDAAINAASSVRKGMIT
jgi:fructose-bisphosphate aldolase class 1